MSYSFADAECTRSSREERWHVRFIRKSFKKFVYSSPRRPYEKERLDQVCLHEIFPLANRCYFQELKLIGEFGLKNKREVRRVKYTLAKIRKAVRELLTLE